MAQSRFYSATAQPTVLTSGITSTQTTINVVAVTGFPASVPYILALDYNTPSEEIVLVTAQAGTTLTVTRAYDGTSGTSHNSGAGVRHTWTAKDGNDSRAHEGSSQGVHGISALSSVVGTLDTQTLSNKTLLSPIITGTISNPDIQGTVTGNATYLMPTFKADVDANPSEIVQKRSGTQTGALTSWRNESGTSLAFITSAGIARWRQGYTAGSSDQLGVDASGNVTTTGATVSATYKSTSMASANANNFNAATTSSTSYVDSTILLSTTVIVPPSGKVFICGDTYMYNAISGNTSFAVIRVDGSVSGVIRDAIDANAIKTVAFNTGDNNIVPGHQSFILTSANIGETLTIKWQHRVNGGAAEYGSRTLNAIPLIG